MARREHLKSRRAGFALLITLLLVTLLAALTAELATTGLAAGLHASRHANTLNHELAVDSVIRVAAERLRNEPSIAVELDRWDKHRFEITLGDCRAVCTIADDGAKFDVTAFATDEKRPLLKRKLTDLGRACGLDKTDIDLQPIESRDNAAPRNYVWFDQLFGRVDPGDLFHWFGGEHHTVWSDVVTCFGSGAVDVRRARREVLEALLEDLDRSLARRIAVIRERGESDTLALVLRDVGSDVRDEVQARIAYNLRRYALTIETAIGADRRQWYAVASIFDDGMEMHNRGQLRW